MNSGLKSRPGASATASAADAASSFDLPITKLSSVYFALRSGRGGAIEPFVWLDEDAAAADFSTKRSICTRERERESTTNSTWHGCPSAMGASDVRSAACFDSFQSAENWSGTATVSLSPRSSTACVGSSQVRKVCSAISRRAHSSNRLQTSCGARSMSVDNLKGRRSYFYPVEKSTRKIVSTQQCIIMQF